MIAQPFSGGSGERTVVVALGGNALLPPGERGDIHQQFAHTRESLAPIVALARDGWRIVVVHGNGPQIGNALLRNELAKGQAEPLPLGVLVAATAGWIGYMVQQSLQNALWRAGVDRLVATIITQVQVDRDDPATREPIKPIGLAMDEERARATGWPVGKSGGGWRRLAPSPRPVKIVERAQIRTLLDAGSIVVAAGGGGTPVYKDPELGLEGLDGVVDKDRAARVLARDIGAHVLLILTNVEGVFQDFGTPTAKLLSRLTAAEAEALMQSTDLGAGAMRPKVEAAVGFVREGGERAHIARLDQGLAAVRGEAGTVIVP